jgi:hypothetical protein
VGYFFVDVRSFRMLSSIKFPLSGGPGPQPAEESRLSCLMLEQPYDIVQRFFDTQVLCMSRSTDLIYKKVLTMTAVILSITHQTTSPH